MTETRSHREQSHDWKLDEALKRTRNAAMMTLLNDDHRSDQEKGQLEDNHSQVEKIKVPDTRKRGRPRKSIKSPKGNHRTSDENLKNGKSRSRARTVANSTKKKQPISKTTVPTSDDDSDSRSHDASGDSYSGRSNNAHSVVPISEKRPRLSVSSSENDSPPGRKNNSASEDDTARWRLPIKRNKRSDSPKKQDKKKSSTKGKSRRPRSRVTNVSDSDSESEVFRSSRIQVAR